jgi:hypothetical protein
MVYEEIEITTKKHERMHKPTDFRIFNSQDKLTITSYRKALPTSLLGTCRLIYQETKSILSRKLEDIASSPLRLILDWEAANTLHTTMCTLPYFGEKRSGFHVPWKPLNTATIGKYSLEIRKRCLEIGNWSGDVEVV